MSAREVVVVTGASAGVGRATALAFAAQGCRIGLLARDTEALADVCRDVEAAGGRALALPADVTDAEAVDAAAAEVERAFGPIDIWVNNAMATVFGPAVEVDAADFRRATEVTYLGAVHGTQAALRRMLARDRGVIVQVGSALSYRAVPLQAAYCGAKFAIRGFTDSVRCELMHQGSRVRITMVQLPAVNTPQFAWARNLMARKPMPLPPIFQPEAAAAAIVHAARSPRRETLVGLSAVKAVWGQRAWPWLLDRIVARTAWSGQLRNEAEDPERPDNLYATVPGVHGVHGTFDGLAARHGHQLWLSRHAGAAVGSLLALAAAGALAAILA